MLRLRSRAGKLGVSLSVGILLACSGLPEELPEGLPGTLPGKLSEKLSEKLSALSARLPALAELRPGFLPIPLEHDLDQGDALAAAALGERVQQGRFPRALAEDCAGNAASFSWLAARHDDPEIVAASLWAMDGCRDALHLPDVEQIAIGRLRHPDPGVAGAAVALAAPEVASRAPGSPLVQGVVDVAVSEHAMPIRIAALEVLDARAWGQEPEVSVAFYDALMAESLPSLTATALERLRFRGVGLTLIDKPRFRAAAMVLAADIDPGIRGFSALALARLSPEDAQVRARVLALLDDPHPYTRSAAAEALAETGALSAVHDLVPRLDHAEPNRWRMLPFTSPDGERARMSFVGSHLERVDDAYLRSLVRLTESLEEPFVYREINLRYKDLDILAATRDARGWYEIHGASIPQP